MTKEATGLLNPRLSWSLGLLTPVVVIPVWIWMIDNRLPNRLGTASGLILIQLLAVSTYTDLTRRKILNAFTFSSILWAILLNLVATLVPRQIPLASVATSNLEWLGAIGTGRCLSGLGICFAVMFFVFMLSGRGAGDVKIAGAIASDVPNMQPTMMSNPLARAARANFNASVNPPVLSNLIFIRS